MLSSLSRAGFVAALHIELPISHSLENTYPAANAVRKFVLNISGFKSTNVLMQ